MSFQNPARPRTPAAPEARWVLRPCDEALAGRLARDLRMAPAVGRVLAARGWSSSEECGAFLSPRLMGLRDPFELRDMDRAVERTLRALRDRETIGVFGDYDVDGVSATALMVQTLRWLGSDPQWFIPHRIDDGYGMQVSRVEELAERGVTLLVTVDTGVTAIAEIARAAELGMDVVVTDHHLAEGGKLPAAVAVVNPNRPDVVYDGARLCGVGVAFKFAHALLKESGRGGEEAKAFLKGLLDLVALGTIADVVPLKGENRILARFGLECLAQSPRPGIRALLKVCHLDDKPLTSEHVGFALGPRINAAGRTDHARTALELLLTEDHARAEQIAQDLEMLNRRRRDDEAGILDECTEQARRQMDNGEDSLLVVEGPTFHLGIVGIVAARLAEMFYRPAIVLRSDPVLARGSARSIPGFDVHEALGACQSYLQGYGGHAAAAGVRLHPDRIVPFRRAINDYAGEILRTRDLRPEIAVDAVLDEREITHALVRDIERLQPFGEDNPPPVFMVRGARSASPARVVGTNHLKLSLRTGSSQHSGIAFRGLHLQPLFETPRPLDLLVRPTENTFRGTTTLELTVLAARESA